MNKRGKHFRHETLVTYLFMFVIIGAVGGLFYFLDGGFTGMVIYSQGDQSEFDLGTYTNTEYNGSAVVLGSGQTSGSYASKVFDANAEANWNNLSWTGNNPNVNFLFAVDGGGDVYESVDLAVSWASTAVNYGRTSDTQYMFSDSNYLYVLAQSNREVWRSDNNGVSWSVVNDSFANSGLLSGEADSSGNIFSVDASGDIYISTDNGVSWILQGDFNGGSSSNNKGIGIDSSDNIFVVDGGGSVWLSSNSGVSWTEQSTGYGGGSGTDDLDVDSSSNVYILNNKEIHKSTDQGLTWNIINNSFTSYSNDGFRIFVDNSDNIFVADGAGRVFKSTDSGVSWQEQGDFNAGAGSNPKGLTDLIQNTNLSFQVRSCDDVECSGESWEGPYGAEELLDNNVDETTDNLAGANMSGNVFLMHLNEGSGDPNDSSGGGNTISLIRGVNYGVSGKFNTALDFNGVDGTIDMDYNDTNFNFSRSGAFTVAGWIKADGLHQGGDAEIISHYQSSTENRVWSLHVRNNVSRFVACGDGTLSSCIYATGTTKINVGNWYHVVGRWDGSNVDVYINGVSEDSQIDSLVGLHTTGAIGVRVARDVSIVGDGYFDGIIDELAIWNRGLSDSEIVNLYNKGIANTFTGSPQDLNLKANQYLQYQINFTTPDSGTTPYVESISINYDLANSVPTISLAEPQNQLYTFNESLSLNFSVSDSDDNLDSCWYTLNSGVINTTLVGCANTTFDIAEGSHTLVVYANDSFNLLVSDSVSFDVDITGVSVSISEPTGAKTSRTGINLTYIVTGNNLTCWYNVKTSIGGNIISNTTLANCPDSSFDVSSDGDYILNLYVNNTFGNSGSDSSSFSVDTSSSSSSSSSSGSSGGGSSGGGSSGGGGISLKPSMNVGSISDLVANKGDSKDLELSIENAGLKFLDGCKVSGFGGYAEWISSSEEKGLAGGEAHSFSIKLNIPETLESGVYSLEVIAMCNGINESVNFNLEILEEKIGFELIKVERFAEDQVKVIYSLEELSSVEQNVDLQFLLFNSDNEKASEVTEQKVISANSLEEFETFMTIDASLEGELNLLINLNSETYSGFVQENIILGSYITGFDVFGETGNSDNILSGVLIVLFLAFAFFMVRRILKHRKKLR